MPAPYGGVVRSSCLGVWFAELGVNGLPALDSSCDLDDSATVDWTSIFRSERTVPCWGSLEVCQRPGELEMQRRKQHDLRFWHCVRILPDDLSLRRFLANFSACHELLHLFFVISETKAFRQGKVVIKQKCFFFVIKDALVGLRFSQFLYSWQWPHKGLTPREIRGSYFSKDLSSLGAPYTRCQFFFTIMISKSKVYDGWTFLGTRSFLGAKFSFDQRHIFFKHENCGVHRRRIRPGQVCE